MVYFKTDIDVIQTASDLRLLVGCICDFLSVIKCNRVIKSFLFIPQNETNMCGPVLYWLFLD